MAEKEVKVKVTTETDIKDVEDLESRLKELQDQKLQIQLESDTAELEEVNNQIEETQAKLDELRADPTVDDSEIQALEDELADLESRQIDLEISVNTAELDEAKASMDELESSSQNATGSVDGLGSALTAVAATAGLEKMVETADNINNSWNRLSLTFAGTGVSIDQLKQKQSELSASTGQTGGVIRSFFNDMGIAGVTNTNLLGSAFESLSGKAYQTGQSVEEMESKFQRMVMSGNASSRMLVSMGITAQDLADAMGVSADQVSEAFKNMTPEERIQALTKAMGDGKEANEMYKNSFQGLKTQAEAAFAGLLGAVGQAILPVVIPMLKLATQAITTLTNAFKGLPEPVQHIIGAIGGMALAGVALVGVLGVVGQIVSTVSSGIQALSGVMRIWNAVTKMVELAQAALNIVMSMNPIFLVIAAIVALIAILWYLYNTNEQVRAAIDGLITALTGIGETIYSYLIGAFETLQSTWQAVVDFITTYGQLLLEAFFVISTGGIGAIVLLIANMNGMPTKIGAILQSVIGRITSFVGNMVSNFVNGAVRAVSGFINGISQLPGKVYNELSKTLSRVIEWGGQIVSRLGEIAQRAWQAFIHGLGIGSPGYIQILTLKELDDTGKKVPNVAQRIITNLSRAATDSVAAWGEPSFDYDINATGSTGSSTVNGAPVISNNYTFNHYGDVDTEERLQRILDFIVRATDWNNDTAGRTV